MSLFVYSLENEFSESVQDTLAFGLEYTDYNVVYLYGLAPVSIIASELCAENEIENYVFLPKIYEGKEVTGELKTIIKNATALIFLPCESTDPELYNKEILKYILQISATKLCLANDYEMVVESMQSIMEAGGDYILLPS